MRLYSSAADWRKLKLMSSSRFGSSSRNSDYILLRIVASLFIFEILKASSIYSLFSISSLILICCESIIFWKPFSSFFSDKIRSVCSKWES